MTSSVSEPRSRWSRTAARCCCVASTKSDGPCSSKTGSPPLSAAGRGEGEGWPTGARDVVKRFTIAVLPGDGIGPEVIAEAERVLEAVGECFGLDFVRERFAIGAAGVAA